MHELAFILEAAPIRIHTTREYGEIKREREGGAVKEEARRRAGARIRIRSEKYKEPWESEMERAKGVLRNIIRESDVHSSSCGHAHRESAHSAVLLRAPIACSARFNSLRTTRYHIRIYACTFHIGRVHWADIMDNWSGQRVFQVLPRISGKFQAFSSGILFKVVVNFFPI